MIRTVILFDDKELISKCGLDAYFFLRYLRTLLIIFVPVCFLVLPILVPINLVGGLNRDIKSEASPSRNNTPGVTGLDTLSWRNVRPDQTARYAAHLCMAILVIFWVCCVFFLELKRYVEIRQGHLISAEHQLHASASTVLIRSIPRKWRDETVLRNMLNVFPGGVKHIWLNRNMKKLMQKVRSRDRVHAMLERAETELIRSANKHGGVPLEERLETIQRAGREKKEEEFVYAKDTEARNPDATMFGTVESCEVTQAPKAPSNVWDIKAPTCPLPTRSSNTKLDDNSLSASAESMAITASKVEDCNPVRGITYMPSHHGTVHKGNSQVGKAAGIKPGSLVPHTDTSNKPATQPRRLKELVRRLILSTQAKFFVTDGSECTVNYPSAHNIAFNRGITGRPTHRLSLFGISWLPSLLPWTRKVDTIYWCRKELARLNVEIEQDQGHPERFPLLPSAFVQFNQQIAAHMACQGVLHHLPRCMARDIDISPQDVLWDNMALSWWQEWLRSILVTAVTCSMVFLWAIPIAWTAVLGQADQLMKTKWLSFLTKNAILERSVKVAAGVLPAVVLSLLLWLVPHILDHLARFKGARTGTQKTEFVQKFYFAFLFVQVFLIVSITSFFAASFSDFMKNVAKLDSVASILDLLAGNLPKASNYFFSYMLLQGLSTSSGTLLQIDGLILQLAACCMRKHTPRSKWKRDINVNTVRWGAYFPVYTNFACIALVYCVMSPLISVFAVVSFGLLWISQRYAMLYIYHFETDTGGVLYPRAINQTFTGLYFMEMCMAGLFFVVEDENAGRPCRPHGVTMIVVLVVTILYQIVLNRSFYPLFRYLPITCQNKAAPEHQPARRRGSMEGRDKTESVRSTADHVAMYDECLSYATQHVKCQYQSEAVGISTDGRLRAEGFVISVEEDESRVLHTDSYNRGMQPLEQELLCQAQRWRRDTVSDNLCTGLGNLPPECKDKLNEQSFLHPAVRAKAPIVWIPKDCLGVSDEEICRTKECTRYVCISNAGADLDQKGELCVVTPPPDSSQLTLPTP